MNICWMIFWFCAAVVVYCYAVYPLLIRLLSRAFAKSVKAPELTDAQLPSAALLIAAHNEESVIAKRIENALATDYPKDRFEIVVACDGCSDNTAAVVSRYVNRGVRLFEYTRRQGKSGALNATMKQIDSDIVLLSDANTELNPDAARMLARWFADPQIGAVCGRLVLVDPKTGKNADGMYWKYETFIKKSEGKLGALLGANGAIYAIRRDLYVPIPSNTIVDDFVIPLLAKMKSGCRIIYDADAVATEETAPDIRGEFRRRSRIGAGGFQALGLLWPLLSPTHGWLAFSFLSHKVLRWLCPFALLAMLLSCAAAASNPQYRSLLMAQLGFYVLAMLPLIVPVELARLRPLRLLTMFASMNAALAVGFGRWLSGVNSGSWDRTARIGENNMLLSDYSRLEAISVRCVTRADLLTAGIFGLLAIALMFDAWRDIFRLGTRTEELSYVLLAPVVIAWVALSRKSLLATCRVRREWMGILILLFGWLVFWYGYVADPVLWRAGAVVVAVGAVVSVLGGDVLWRLLPVFAATIFLVPVSPTGRYQIAMPLQVATAQATQSVCDLLGIYVTRSGNLLSVNGMDVTIAEACNGMRMVMTLLMVCYVVAFTSEMKGHLRLLLLLASPVVAIVANVIRLVPTVWMFGHKPTETAEAFHDASGWVMIVLAFLFLMGMVRVARWAATPDADEPNDGLAAGLAVG
jgi:exosortase